MGYKSKMRWNERQEFDAASLTTSYQSMRASGWDNPPVAIKMVNNSDVDVDVSFDGSTDHDFIAASTAFVWDLRANASLDKGGFAEANQIWVKAAAAGTGDIYAVSIYQERT